MSQEGLAPVLCSLQEHLEAAEVALVSTCNRTEVYTSEVDPQQVQQWFVKQHGVTEDTLLNSSYQFHDHGAVRHIMRVASGLDSLVLGEPQILGQVKSAYATAKDLGAVGKVLGRLFETAFAVAKTVRTSTGIGRCPVSVAYAAVKLSAEVFSDITQQSVLLVGAGETVELCARHLFDKGVKQLYFANRTYGRAEDLAADYNGISVPLQDLHDVLPKADIVMTATASSLPLLGKGSVETALKLRRQRPMFVVDLGVPRNVEAEVAELDDVYLYTVDDLQTIVTENVESRMQAAEHAEHMIHSHASDFMSWLRSLEAVAAIKQYREQAFIARDKTVARAMQALERGQSAAEVINRLGELLTNQLIHEPTVALRSLAEDGEQERLEVATRLLGLE